MALSSGIMICLNREIEFWIHVTNVAKALTTNRAQWIGVVRGRGIGTKDEVPVSFRFTSKELKKGTSIDLATAISSSRRLSTGELNQRWQNVDKRNESGMSFPRSGYTWPANEHGRFDAGFVIIPFSIWELRSVIAGEEYNRVLTEVLIDSIKSGSHLFIHTLDVRVVTREFQ